MALHLWRELSRLSPYISEELLVYSHTDNHRYIPDFFKY